MTCSVSGCDREVKVISSGLCGMHYQRLRRHGNVSVTLIDRNDGSDCAFESCGRKAKVKGWCATHYAQIQRGETPYPIKPRARNTGPTYLSIHQTLKRKFGPARDYPCEICDDQAEQWCLYVPAHVRPNLPVDPTFNGFAFSTNLDDYAPLCRSCHSRLDNRPAPAIT